VTIMKIINLCPHPFNLYKETQFVGLKQDRTNLHLWRADQVYGEPLLSIAPSGIVARVDVKSMAGPNIILNSQSGDEISVATVTSKYGGLTFPEDKLDGATIFLVSLTFANHAANTGKANHFIQWLVTPYKVVRYNTPQSDVIGACGFNFVVSR